LLLQKKPFCCCKKPWEKAFGKSLFAVAKKTFEKNFIKNYKKIAFNKNYFFNPLCS